MMPIHPQVPLRALDTLWFQVAGTICNLTCNHCFISCSPTNQTHAMMTLAQVTRALDDAAKLGVREFYFTGGEPFMNRELLPMLEAALALGPTSVLTNGVLIKPAQAEHLAALAKASEYSLDLRISIDGWSAATNDPLRGEGTFTRILDGIRIVAAAGLNPVITITEAFEEAQTQAGRARFLEFLRSIGLDRPRLKILPLLRLGAEAKRGRVYAAWETLAGRVLSAEDLDRLQCSSSRMVTASGVWVCPILLDEPGARLGATLGESAGSFPLAHPACFTCHAEGLSCRT